MSPYNQGGLDCVTQNITCLGFMYYANIASICDSNLAAIAAKFTVKCICNSQPVCTSIKSLTITSGTVPCQIRIQELARMSKEVVCESDRVCNLYFIKSPS